jgi:transcriptional regulator with XRE-family HTH domain
MSVNNFVTWLTGEMDRRGWNNSELGRRAGLVPSAISQVISGTRNPGLEFCIKIAKPLDMTPEEVLMRAGLLPRLSAPEETPPIES